MPPTSQYEASRLVTISLWRQSMSLCELPLPRREADSSPVARFGLFAGIL
jgi:hypothetical protein